MKLSDVKGIGDKTEKLLNKLGIQTADDLLNYFPRDYETYDPPVFIKDIEGQGIVAIQGVITEYPKQKKINNLQITGSAVKDELGSIIKVTWYNMPYIKNKLQVGYPYVFRGKISTKYSLSLEQPAVYTIHEYEDKKSEVWPKYALTKGLSNNLLIKSVKQILNSIGNSSDFLPDFIKEKYSLPDYSFAIKNIHFPSSFGELIKARNRLSFDEFFLFLYTLRKFKEKKVIINNNFKIIKSSLSEDLINSLPYSLTASQLRTYEEIRADLMGEKMMSRLIQGDVGSGKTIIAVLSLVCVCESGYQGAFMVPTEVLANQHYHTITKLFEENNIPIKTVLLTGSMTIKEKRAVCELIESGEAGIIIGTHALIQESVNYHNLALVITDEQHRFGVRQRELFSKKGKEPNILVMSATPIPRTLALILYGDMDISVINELPADRLPIKNCVVLKDYRPNAYRFIKNEVAKGRQAYVICPMVEDSEDIDAENVIDYSANLQTALGKEITVEYLHGRMKANEKNNIMNRFLNNEIQVLVSTTVIEVGVNVPNATVMMIENAERFGLAALHQLRGRVGRGKEQSYCIFVSGTSKPETLEKLEILNKSNDGFVIANEDLKSRGPGDIFGIRQSGDLRFRVGDIYQDADIIKSALEAVELYYEKMPQMNPEDTRKIDERCRLTNELLML